MIRKRLVLVLMGLILTAVTARAEDEPSRQEVDQLKQRIEELEKKQEKDAEEFGKLSDLAKYVSIGGVLSGAYQYEWVSGPSDPDDLGRGAVAFQPEISITPTENDEYTQFMNEALVNASNGFLPSWDIGGPAEWDIGRFGVRGVYMNVGENDDGNNYNFYGTEVNGHAGDGSRGGPLPGELQLYQQGVPRSG